MPDDPGATVVTNARAFYTTRAAAGALGTRHSPRPHWAEGYAQPGRNAPRDRGVASDFTAMTTAKTELSEFSYFDISGNTVDNMAPF
jgi:hypothetical protein